MHIHAYTHTQHIDVCVCVCVLLTMYELTKQNSMSDKKKRIYCENQ